MSGADLACAVLLLSGVTLFLTAGVGLVRLPDALCRAHGVAKATSLGVALLLAGAWIPLADGEARWKLLLAIVFQLATIPVASQMLARAAIEKNLPRWRERPVNHPLEGRGPGTGGSSKGTGSPGAR